MGKGNRRRNSVTGTGAERSRKKKKIPVECQDVERDADPVSQRTLKRKLEVELYVDRSETLTHLAPWPDGDISICCFNYSSTLGLELMPSSFKHGDEKTSVSIFWQSSFNMIMKG